jgi:foldase protein PrsA
MERRRFDISADHSIPKLRVDPVSTLRRFFSHFTPRSAWPAFAGRVPQFRLFDFSTFRIFLLLLLSGCLPSSQDMGPAVGDAVRYRDQLRQAPLQRTPPAPLTPEELRAKGDEAIIATVNNAAISRGAVTNLLIRSHGVGVLEQLIGLETAAQHAAAKGVNITQQDVEREYDSALRRLVNPLATVTGDEFDRPQAERLLGEVLAQRNISREEFFIILRRNAYLRAILEKEIVPSEEQIRAEFERSYGERVVVRHIQLGSPGDVARLKERLAAGNDFAALAGRYSANSASGKQGGLLEPFARNDEDLPELFRRASFALRPGEVSEAVRIGQWEHLIKLEQTIPAGETDFEAVRGEIASRLRERLIEERMPKLYEELFRAAVIQIEDPALRETFFARHPELLK